MKKEKKYYRLLNKKLDEYEYEENNEYEEKSIIVGKKIFDIIDKNTKQYYPFIIETKWSDVIKEKNIILLCDTPNIGSVLYEQTKNAPYKDFLVQNSKRADISVIDLGKFVNARIFKVTECSYSIANDNSLDTKPEMFEMSFSDAKISYVVHESSKLLEDHETMNLRIENLNSQLLSVRNAYKLKIKQDKREKQKFFENVVKEKKFNAKFKNPPKDLYIVTFLGYILFVIMIIFYIINIKG
jgi:hypothetical protein